MLIYESHETKEICNWCGATVQQSLSQDGETWGTESPLSWSTDGVNLAIQELFGRIRQKRDQT